MFATKSRMTLPLVARVIGTRRVTLPSTINRRFFNATGVVLEKHITKVPTMGDSITEVRRLNLIITLGNVWKLYCHTKIVFVFWYYHRQGTIVEWTAQVGQRVEEEVRRKGSTHWNFDIVFCLLKVFFTLGGLTKWRTNGILDLGCCSSDRNR